MNQWQIIGGIISIIGTLVMFYGSYLQAESDEKFQTKVQSFVRDEQAQNRPNLVVVSLSSTPAGTVLLVKNVGKRPAKNVRVVFTEDSVPSAFVSNLIVGAAEIPNGVEYQFRIDLFSGIKLLTSVPNSDKIYQEALQNSIKKFEAGEMAFIPRFQLEYEFEGEEIKSSKHFIVMDKRGFTLNKE
jgi:hypothetical protein